MPDLNQCPCTGKNLDKLLQPMILLLLLKESLHGYALIRKIAQSPMFDSQQPDPAGVYRTLKTMGDRGLVSSEWGESLKKLPKKVFSITPKGRECLLTWIGTLEGYRKSIKEFLMLAHEVFQDT